MANVREAIGKSIRNAKANFGAQSAIEKMQIALATGTVNAAKVVRAAAKRLKDLMDREAQAKKLKVSLLSDFEAILKLYNDELSKTTMEELEKDAYESQARVLKYASKEQIEIVSQWAKEKAKVTLAEINGIHDILVAKKLKVTHTALEGEMKKVVDDAKVIIQKEDKEKEEQRQGRGPVRRQAVNA